MAGGSAGGKQTTMKAKAGTLFSKLKLGSSKKSSSKGGGGGQQTPPAGGNQVAAPAGGGQSAPPITGSGKLVVHGQGATPPASDKKTSFSTVVKPQNQNVSGIKLGDYQKAVEKKQETQQGGNQNQNQNQAGQGAGQNQNQNQPGQGGNQNQNQPPASVLNDGEKKRLGKIQKSIMLGVMMKAGQLDLAGRPSTNPDEGEFNWLDGVELGGGIADTALEMIDAGATTLNGVLNSVKGAEELPYIGPIIAGISATWELVKLGVDVGKQIYLLAKKKAIDKWKIVEMLKSSMDIIGTMVGGLVDLLGDLGVFTQIPLVGAVIGTISGAVDVAMSTIHLYKSIKHESRMGAQGKALATATGAKQTTSKTTTADQATGRLIRVDENNQAEAEPIRAEIFAIDSQLKTLKPSEPGDKPKIDQLRKERAEKREKLAAIDQKISQDMVYELEKANVKRKRRNGMELAQGFVSIGTSLATIDPTYGSAIGGGVSMASTLAGGAVKATGFARQKIRNRGWFGSDVNKSEKNKRIRRHNLALGLFDSMKEIGRTDLGFISENDVNTDGRAKTVKAAMDQFKTVGGRVEAMDINIPRLWTAGSSDKMVGMLREGFYRESR